MDFVEKLREYFNQNTDEQIKRHQMSLQKGAGG